MKLHEFTRRLQAYEIHIRFHPQGATSYIYSDGDVFNEDFESPPYEDVDDAVAAAMAWLQNKVTEAITDANDE